MKSVYWNSVVPLACQISGRSITDKFADGSINGRWGCFDPDEFYAMGGEYGIGRGQLFEKQSDGKWLKTKG